jgi:hypothetical protein
VIEPVVPERTTAQGSPAEEQQQLKDHDIEDKANEEYPPLSDTEDEKMYQDADEVESFRVEAPIHTSMLRALLEHLGITTTPKCWIKEVPHPGRVEFKAIVEIFLDPKSSADTRDSLSGPLTTTLLLMPSGRPSHRGSIATRVGCKTPSTTSFPTGRRMNSRPMG